MIINSTYQFTQHFACQEFFLWTKRNVEVACVFGLQKIVKVPGPLVWPQFQKWGRFMKVSVTFFWYCHDCRGRSKFHFFCFSGPNYFTKPVKLFFVHKKLCQNYSTLNILLTRTRILYNLTKVEINDFPQLKMLKPYCDIKNDF